MSGLLPDEAVWMRSDSDRLIELMLVGRTPKEIQAKMDKPLELIMERIRRYHHSPKALAKYKPFRRISRKDKPLTETERVLIKGWKNLNVPTEDQCRFLCRRPRELGLDGDDLKRLGDLRAIGTGVDLVLAYRYLYYCHHISILSDRAYDDLEKEETEFGAHGNILQNAPSSDNPEDYPPHIRALGMYLGFKYSKRESDNDKEKS